MMQPEDLVGEEWAEWYRLTPAQRWLESEKLWQTYLALGGSLDPEPDTQSPFFDARASRPRPAHGRAGLRVLRRGRIRAGNKPAPARKSSRKDRRKSLANPRKMGQELKTKLARRFLARMLEEAAGLTSSA
jgi:hypothetical protein